MKQQFQNQCNQGKHVVQTEIYASAPKFVSLAPNTGAMVKITIKFPEETKIKLVTIHVAIGLLSLTHLNG